MLLHHYHTHDGARRPVVSVCLVEDDDGVFSRGIAVCSPLDFGNLTKKKGKLIARNRALKAANTRESYAPIARPHVVKQIRDAGGLVIYFSNGRCKAAYNVQLTLSEDLMVEQRRDEIQAHRERLELSA